MFVTRQTYVADEVRKLGAEILIDASDELIPSASASMNKYCRKGRCVFYRRHCDAKELICSFVYGDEDQDAGEIDLALSLEIRANSKAALLRAARNIWVELEVSNNSKFYVTLTRLDVESAEVSPAICSNRAWIQGCSPPRPIGAIPR